MDTAVLSDPAELPSPELLSKLLGSKFRLYCKTLEYLRLEVPESKPEWNYYNDGKSWLLRILLSRKTLCWISVHERGFGAAFYISGKYERDVLESKLPATLKREYLRTGAKKIRGIRLGMDNAKDLSTFTELVKIKRKAM